MKKGVILNLGNPKAFGKPTLIVMQGGIVNITKISAAAYKALKIAGICEQG